MRLHHTFETALPTTPHIVPQKVELENRELTGRPQLAGWSASLPAKMGWIVCRPSPRTETHRPFGDFFEAKVDTVPPGVSRRRVLEPTGARERVHGPDVIPTATAKGARDGARVGIMSVGCPRTAGRATKSGQAPNPVDVS